MLQYLSLRRLFFTYDVYFNTPLSLARRTRPVTLSTTLTSSCAFWVGQAAVRGLGASCCCRKAQKEKAEARRVPDLY